MRVAPMPVVSASTSQLARIAPQAATIRNARPRLGATRTARSTASAHANTGPRDPVPIRAKVSQATRPLAPTRSQGLRQPPPRSSNSRATIATPLDRPELMVFEPSPTNRSTKSLFAAVPVDTSSTPTATCNHTQTF